MTFVKFTNKGCRNGKLFISCNKLGVFVFSSRLTQEINNHYGDYPYCVLYFDNNKKAVGFKFYQYQVEDSFPVIRTDSNYKIQVMRFCKVNKLFVKNTKRYIPIFLNEMYIINF